MMRKMDRCTIRFLLLVIGEDTDNRRVLNLELPDLLTPSQVLTGLIITAPTWDPVVAGVPVPAH